MDPSISDHHAIIARISREKIKAQSVLVERWKPDIEDIEFARATKPKIDIQCDGIHSAVETLGQWLQELRQRATKKIKVHIGKKRWYGPELKQIEAQMKISHGEEKRKLRNMYVQELAHAQKEADDRTRARNRSKGVWGIINRTRRGGAIILKSSDGALINAEKEQAQMFAKHFQDKVKKLQVPSNPGPVLKVLEEKMKDVPQWDIHEVDQLTVSV